MKTTNSHYTAKRIYLKPQMFCIELDNQISLALESSPPEGPNEVMKFSENNHFNPQTGLV